MRGAQPGALTFVASQQGRARHKWERAFAVCYRLQNRPSAPESVRLGGIPSKYRHTLRWCRWAQVQGGRDMVLQTPSPGEVVIDVLTAQAPARAGSPLDLLEAEGLTPD
ncbi:hypothetical protein SKAU_G00207290 [Synaphobranchus kaupii]|uniref:Uncharacterized protein n=1 Tax=Synaphobranchus kaupii TaxID=118154 RepID=A0A9Q1ITP2_SYNKA|nr:hypothetical protein SKAU_G00207290 [Synaphobranchus kaupii]